MTQEKPFSVAIIGGGIVGVVLALALRHRKIDVQLYERAVSFSEVSASLGVNVSAVDALRICGPEALAAFEKVKTRPADPNVAMHFRDNYNQPPVGEWTVPWDGHMGGVHRGQFLDALVASLPEHVVHFQKSLTHMEQPAKAASGEGSDDRVKMSFSDGSTAFADVVVGADGIGSRVRRIMLGDEHPAAKAKYAHQCVYRSVIPMEKAVKIVGTRPASCVTQWFGKGGTVVTVPIAQGKLFGISAIVRDPSSWPSTTKLVLPASKDDVVQYFSNWGPEIRGLVDTIDPGRVDRWALFDLDENPPPFYARGRVALVGDAAHAMTPHQGSGAMVGIEDAAVLAELLADDRMRGKYDQVAAAMEVYNELRLPRGHGITRASRRTGDLMHLLDPEVLTRDEKGDSEGEGEEVVDFEKLRALVMANFKEAWNREVLEQVKLAKETFGRRIAPNGTP